MKARTRTRTRTNVACPLLIMTAVCLHPAAQSAEAEAHVQLAQVTRRTNTTLDDVVVAGQRERSTVALDSVSDTGSRLGIELRDLPASVSVVSQEVMQLQGARTAIEAIGSAVGMTGGISVGSIPSFATRGFTGNDLTIMRDGIRQNTGSQSSRPLDSFLFDRIEVLKGPASLMYGEGAVGGAINYVSKQPSDMFGGEAYVSGGSWNALRYGVGVGGPTGIDGLTFRADASRSTGDGYQDRSDYEYSAFAGALRWQRGMTNLTLSSTYLKDFTHSYYGTPVVYDGVIDQNGHFVNNRRANTTTDTLVNARIVPGTERLNYNNLDNFARAENSFNRLILNADVGGNWTLRNEVYVATQRLSWRNTESTAWNPAKQLVERGSFFLIYRNDEEVGNRVDLTWNGKIAGRTNRLLIGVNYDHNDQVRNSGQTYTATPTPIDVPLFGFDPGIGPPVSSQRTLRIDVDTKAAYIENFYEPLDVLKIVAGIRFDRIDIERRSYVNGSKFAQDYDPFTGRLGVMYAPTDTWNIYASYSKAAQPVSQLVSLAPDQTGFSLQKGRQYEIGTKTSLWAKKAELTVALFDIEKNDLLTNVDIPGQGRVPSQIGAQVSQGIEVAMALTPARDWRVDANLAYTRKAEFDEFNENLGTNIVPGPTVISRDGNTPTNVPKIVAGLFFAKEFGPLTTTIGARHVGERQANNNNGIQMEAYTTVDASVIYRWEQLQFTLRGRNLTDEAYSDWSNGGGLVQRLGDPRSAELDVRVKF